MINNPICVLKSEQLVHILALEQTLSHPYVAPDPQSNEPNYDIILRGATAVQANKKLVMIHDWLMFLERPNRLSDQDYTALVRQASHFFLDEYILWKRDPKEHISKYSISTVALKLYMWDMTTQDTVAFTQPELLSSSTIGGLLWARTSCGMSRCATFVKAGKLNKCSSHPSSQLLCRSSRRCTWTLCTYRTLVALHTSCRGDAH
jgi:hypothetical protein